MNKIKKGDIVGRNSYNKDIIFIVKNTKDKKKILLEGLFERIVADSDINDLVLIDKSVIDFEKNTRENKICIQENRLINNGTNGTILHLDGDKRYSEKSLKYYRRMGINAIVRNIPENKQPFYVYNLLKYYNPDILVITGHDGMFMKEKRKYDIFNYRNSKYFVQTVKEARRYERDYNKNLVIFAGACQSFYEALIESGANFTSSPARILIDILDPLIVAKTIATTDEYEFINMDDIEHELRDGKKGIDGIGARREKKIKDKRFEFEYYLKK